MLNLLIQIPGATFLIYFSIFSISCIVTSWFLVRNSDNSTSYSLPTLTRFNAFELAALRDGRKGVIQTALFNLWQKDKLSVAGKEQTAVIHRNPNADHTVSLNPIEETIYQSITTSGQNPAYFFQDKALHAAIDIHLRPINRTLEGAHLKQTDAVLTTNLGIRRVILLLILGVGLTKLSFGIYYGKPVLFLIILLIIFMGATLTILQLTHTTQLGRRYLKKLNEHFAWIKSESPDKFDPTLAVAIFGVTVLAGFSPFSPFEQAFAGTATSGSSSNGGCGGGCGGGSGDGGGGGGGCGGCGGGGD